MTTNSSANGNNIATSDSNRITILTFQMAGQLYGLPVTAVRQLIEMVTIIQLPQAPPAIQGVINVRGQIVPIMDLRLRFDLEYLPYQLHTPIILVEVNGRLLGIVVDEVDTVLENISVDIQTYDTIFDSEMNGTFNQMAYLSCIAKVDDRIIPILSVSQILHHHEETKLAHLLNELTNNETDNETERQPKQELEAAGA